MTVSKELEAVARAICIASYTRRFAQSNRSEPPQQAVDLLWTYHLPEACAALTAIREPSEGMLAHQYKGPVTAWKATIDFIIEDTG